MKRTAMPAGVLAAALLLAACSSGSGRPAEAKASPSAATYGCLTKDQAAKGSFALEAGTESMPAYYQDSDAGHARTAIILSHQLNSSLCEWIPYLPEFTKAGYAVLAFTTEGDVTEGIKGGTGYLKEKGVTKVALIGASKGGTASLVAARLENPLPIAAVVSLSGPESSGQANAGTAVKVSKVPTLFAVEEMDGRFTGDAKSLYAAAVTPDKELRIYSGSSHGAPLLKEGAMPDVQAFLAKHAPAAG